MFFTKEEYNSVMSVSSTRMNLINHTNKYQITTCSLKEACSFYRKLQNVQNPHLAINQNNGYFYIIMSTTMYPMFIGTVKMNVNFTFSVVSITFFLSLSHFKYSYLHGLWYHVFCLLPTHSRWEPLLQFPSMSIMQTG